MKNLLSVITGIIISVVIAGAGVYLILYPIVHKTGKSPESIMHYAYFFIYPASIFLGSILTGYLIGHNIERKKIKSIIYLPGVYVSIPYFYSIIMAPAIALFMLIAVTANIFTSFFGLHLGARIKNK